MLDLVQRYQEGNKNAFDELFTRFHAQVLRTAYFITRNVQEAEDVVQDVFLDVHRDLTKLREPERFPSWLHKITIHQSLRRVRARKDAPLDELRKLLADPSSLGMSPEEQLTRAERMAILREAMEELNPVQRSVLALKYFNELVEREIAEALGCSIGTVKSRLHYAKKELAAILRRSERPLLPSRKNTADEKGTAKTPEPKGVTR